MRPLSEAEIAAIPVLAAGSAMRFFLTRLYDWLHTPKDALVSPKDPKEYWAILRFHPSVAGVCAYGFDSLVHSHLQKSQRILITLYLLHL